MTKIVQLKRGQKLTEGLRDSNSKLGWSRRRLARELGISEKTVYRAEAMGELKTITFAGVVIVPFSEIERLKKMFGLHDHEEP